MGWKHMILILGITFSFSVWANPGQDSGNRLLEQCGAFLRLIDKRSDNYEPLSAGMCAGYIQGASDFNTVQFATTGEGNFCIPEQVNLGQKIRILVKYLHDNPAELHEPRFLLVIRAFSDAFPCED